MSQVKNRGNKHSLKDFFSPNDGNYWFVPHSFLTVSEQIKEL